MNETVQSVSLVIILIGALVAAAWLGFSAAMGALFAGLAFSRDPEAVRIDAGFSGVYHLLAPFFFIGIGLALEVGSIASALLVGTALAAVAIAGKIIGLLIPALTIMSGAGATLIAVSLVPRAEITMIIVERGRKLGEWAVPPELYGAFVLVSALTCLIAPLGLGVLFRRWPSEVRGEEAS